jgi:serine/threonine protein kinase
MEVRSTDEPVDVTCDASHIELLAGLDVSVIDESGNPVSTLDMNITNSQGVERLRRVTFGSNMLVPFVSGGRLGDLADNSPLFRSILNRFLVYTYISTQLVEAVKKLHSLGVVHGGISPSNIYCVSASCEEVVLGEFSRAYTEKDPLLPSLKYALEISQDSVRMMAMEKDLKDDVDPKITKMLMDYASKPVTWDSARKVDWFGLGGALFYVVSGSRFYVDSMDSSKTSSRMLSDFIFASLSQKEMTNRVTDTKSKAALEKIRDQVAEGLALIDGLLVVDRSKRISFDTELGRSRMTTSLRANKAVLSALQTDSKVLGNTCASFLKETRRILGSDSKDETIPSFIQQIC